MQQAAESWKTRGVAVLGVVGQRPVPVQRLRTKRGIEFPIVIDADRSIIKRFGVYHRFGFDALNIARPAIFVLDALGIVRWEHIARNQLDRPSIAQIDAALEAMARELVQER
ncbi:redoxin domain-containing protein [bacterium]|nr:MAG: redoxin domain-containing protein [bacterium]